MGLRRRSTSCSCQPRCRMSIKLWGSSHFIRWQAWPSNSSLSCCFLLSMKSGPPKSNFSSCFLQGSQFWCELCHWEAWWSGNERGNNKRFTKIKNKNKYIKRNEILLAQISLKHISLHYWGGWYSSLSESTAVKQARLSHPRAGVRLCFSHTACSHLKKVCACFPPSFFTLLFPLFSIGTRERIWEFL